jgi:dTDP-glucose 4,6-dehydratase
LTIRQFAEGGRADGVALDHLPPAARDDPKVRQPDITRARTLLQWEPKVDLDTGLRRTLAYFKQRLGHQS